MGGGDQGDTRTPPEPIRLPKDYYDVQEERDEAFRLRQAEHAHARHGHIADRIDAQVLSFANAAMRAPAIAAYGAIAAVLAFLSTNAGQLDEVPSMIGPYLWPMLYFGGSLLAAIVAPSFAYLSAASIAERKVRERHGWQHPYVTPTTASRWWNRAGIGFRVVAIALVVSSVVLLVAGALTSWSVAMNGSA